MLRLGPSFSIAVRDLLPLQEQKPLSDNHYREEFRKLKDVYDKYTADKVAIQRESGMANFYRMLPMTLMALVSMGAACIPALRILSPFIAVIGLGLLVFSLFKSFNGSRNNPEKLEALNKQFMIDYVCPKCGNFLGFLPFENLETRLPVTSVNANGYEATSASSHLIGEHRPSCM